MATALSTDFQFLKGHLLFSFYLHLRAAHPDSLGHHRPQGSALLPAARPHTLLAVPRGSLCPGPARTLSHFLDQTSSCGLVRR